MKNLYATMANGRWFVKQATSPDQFRRLCLIDERSNGYSVPPNGRKNYDPDFVWNESGKRWDWLDGRPYGPKLPGRR